MPTHKRSKKRDAILACVRSTDTHPTADWVYAQLKPQIPDLSLGTVYRNLAMFKQEGLIDSIGIVDGMERFDRNCVPHTHFVCTHCHAVIDVENIELPEHLIDQVHCGSVRSCSLTFSGICNQCAPNGAEHQ